MVQWKKYPLFHEGAEYVRRNNDCRHCYCTRRRGNRHHPPERRFRGGDRGQNISYTGEDVVEIQIHGSAEALRETLALALRSGAVPAMRGEFTKRAFLNGRLDLAQAEAVMDIISAKGEAALTQAESDLSGALSGFVHGVMEVLKDLFT